MRPQRKEQDCHTKAIIDAIARFKSTGLGRNVFISSRGEFERHINDARNFLAGEFPVIASMHMSQITLGNGQNGKGLGFMIMYMDARTMSINNVKSIEAHITVLDQAMLMHQWPLDRIRELEEVIAIKNSRY